MFFFHLNRFKISPIFLALRKIPPIFVEKLEICEKEEIGKKGEIVKGGNREKGEIARASPFEFYLVGKYVQTGLVLGSLRNTRPKTAYIIDDFFRQNSLRIGVNAWIGNRWK